MSHTTEYLQLFDDIQGQESLVEKKPLLAHYTSLAALESILKNNQIWLSNPLFMNDFEELSFGMMEGLKLFLESEDLRKVTRTQDRYSRLQKAFEGYYGQFQSEHAIDTYVLSFCEHDPLDDDGKLSMWRGYGVSGDGACIVFDSGKVSSVDSSPLMFGKVDYATRADRLKKMEGYVNQLCQVISENEIPDEELWLASYYLFERFKLFALLSKHLGFREEDEWRLIYLSERDKNQLLYSMIGYVIGSRGIEPKLRLEIAPIEGAIANDISLNNIIERIILGPTTSSPLSKAMTEKMFDQLKMSELKAKLRTSSIPFRKMQS